MQLEKSVAEQTEIKEGTRDKLRQTAEQNEADRRKLKLYKLQSQQERLDTSMLLQQMQAARVSLSEAQAECAAIRGVAEALSEAKQDLASAVAGGAPPLPTPGIDSVDVGKS